MPSSPCENLEGGWCDLPFLNKGTVVNRWLQKAINRQGEGIEIPTLQGWKISPAQVVINYHEEIKKSQQLNLNWNVDKSPRIEIFFSVKKKNLIKTLKLNFPVKTT